MEIRAGTSGDQASIAAIARESLAASYSLSPATIENAVEQWYGPDEYTEKLSADGVFFLVLETDDVVGFSESIRVAGRGQGDILWLHVHPGHRGQGIGSALFEATRDRLREAGVQYIRGRVLTDNDAGAAFYTHHGFEQVGEKQIEIDGDHYVEHIFLLPDVDPDPQPT